MQLIFQLYRGGPFLFVDETRVPGENHQLAASHWQTLSHIEYASPFANTLLLNKQTFTFCLDITIYLFVVVVHCFLPIWVCSHTKIFYINRCSINPKAQSTIGNLQTQATLDLRQKTKTNETTSTTLKTYREATQTTPNIGWTHSRLISGFLTR